MILREQNWFSVSKFIEQIFAHNKFAHCEQILWAIFFYEQFSWALSNFFADVSSKIIALADPVLSQPDIEREMVSPPAGAYIPSFTICHVLPDLSAHSVCTCTCSNNKKIIITIQYSIVLVLQYSGYQFSLTLIEQLLSYFPAYENYKLLL